VGDEGGLSDNTAADKDLREQTFSRLLTVCDLGRTARTAAMLQVIRVLTRCDWFEAGGAATDHLAVT